ncbi:BMP family ABC transporter substrate-binding protein [Pueribacillus theae]|uniref:BMP family ABC transporter substrate-binding protein n=1 Tax=Pueribacillus theae TaxID=2171751 RepID=A0A2U1JV87_9BACI|nr:ABC transporter substrate-binding protein [Pueribacillus theae]PWA09062.1 BMP family ABC transporter substrate-binding protein [Pueribacillus theae]
MRRKWTKIVGASFLSLALLAACGTSDKEKEEGSAGGKDKEKSAETVTVGISQYVTHRSLDAATKGFKAALEESDLDVKFNDQNAQGDPNNAASIAQNLVGDKVDLIFANATPSAIAALNETKDIPIVFTSVTDPVGSKLVESMEKPGGNVTGTSDTHPDAIPNTVKFIDEQMDAKTIGLIFNAGEQNSQVQIDAVKEAVKGTDLKTVEATVSTSAEVKQAAESLIGRADVFYVITDNTVVSAIETVVQVASDNDIPLFVGEHDSVEAGGFAAYGTSYYDLGYQTGKMAIQILKGEKTPDQIPAEYPSGDLDLLINKKAAEDMGVKLKPEWDDIAEYLK